MNKFVNILQLLILFPCVLVCIFVGFDLPIDFLKTSGENLPYKSEIFLGFALLLLIVGLRRSIRRWVGVRMVNQLKRFQWNEKMNESRVKQVFLYQVLESIVHLLFSAAIYALTPEAWVISLVLLLLAIEHLVFGIYGKTGNKFRIGITSKALVIADRDIKVLYFSGLRRITTQQQSVFFEYIQDLQMSFSTSSIADEHREEFREAIAKNVNRDKVFFSDGFKNL